jgi:Tfp pilus assembly protein PilF
MTIDYYSIVEGIITYIIGTSIFIILSVLVGKLYLKNKNFKSQFRVAKSPFKINPKDFDLSGGLYNEYYLKRVETESKSGKYSIVEDKISEKLKNEKDVTILAKPDAGKTRCAYEVVKELPRHFVILIPRYDGSISAGDLKQPDRTWYLKKKHYVLFLDDAQQYAEKTWIADLIDRIQEKNPVSVLTTIRTGNELIKAKSGPLFKLGRCGRLLNDNDVIEDLRDLKPNEMKKLGEGTGNEVLQEYESVGTPGIIITQNWKPFIDRYLNLDNVEAKLLMKAGKLLALGGNFIVTRERLMAAVPAMEGPKLTKTQIQTAESILKDEDIIGWDMDERTLRSGGKILWNIVEDYPPDEDIQQHHFHNLMDNLYNINDHEALFNLGVAFHNNREMACEAYEKAVAIKDDKHEAWNNWGTYLAELAKAVYPENEQEGRELFEKAFVKYEKAVAIKDDEHEAWYNWGTSLAELAKAVYPENKQEGRELFEKAFVKYEKAVAIKDDEHKAWNNWGTYLGKLAKAVYPENEQEGRELFEKAFVKYEKAVAIKDDKHDAWYNWGNYLGELAKAVYPENKQEGRELFEKAEEKVTQALKYSDSPQYRGLHGMILLALEKIDEGIEENVHAALLCALGNNAQIAIYELSTAWSHLEDAESARPIVLKSDVALAVYLKLFKAEQWLDDLLPILEQNMSSLDGRSKLLLNWVKGNGIEEGETALADENDVPIDVLLALLFSTIEKMEHETSEV